MSFCGHEFETSGGSGRSGSDGQCEGSGDAGEVLPGGASTQFADTCAEASDCQRCAPSNLAVPNGGTSWLAGRACVVLVVTAAAVLRGGSCEDYERDASGLQD